VIAYFVSQRTHEIGVRVALGASSASVLKMVVGQGLVLALIGITIGAILATLATRVLQNMLFEVGARDPVAYAAAGTILLLVALVASWIPARRAMRVDPVRALTSSA